MINYNFFSEIRFKYILFFILGLIAVYLCQSASKDWSNYQWLFSIDNQKSWTQMLSEFSIFKEPAYFVLSKLGGEVIGFSLFMGIVTIITLVIKLNYLSKIVDSVPAACFFYFCLYFFLFDTTVLRVAYATALVIPAFYFLQHKRISLSFLLVGLASQIHLTTIAFMIIYPLYWVRQLNFVVLGIFILSPILIWIDFSAFDWLIRFSMIFTDKYQFYARPELLQQQNSTGLYFYFIGFYYLLVAGIYFYLRDEILTDPFKSVMASIAMLGVIIMCLLHDNVAVGARLGELFLISTVLLLSWVYLNARAKQQLLIQISMIVVFSSYAVARFFYLFPNFFE
ncbi:MULTISPECIES: EpsG family protein [unclassified Methylophaga]|uniref:EpsG family protein n=1 Tax=unclassified Methylophaga TaxID=2629249 RepID=UPI000C932D66|nr:MULTISPECIES: EpsG family protein [unclassified Methylophaga]MAP27046.1 hypothetical protein [Methylophaga sp.]HCO01204.1 hypothetical protein [Methylophaga sp.]